MTKRETTGAVGLLYQLAAASPTCAGVLFALYAFFLSGFGLSKLDALKRFR